jgi:hypothetical protein
MIAVRLQIGEAWFAWISMVVIDAGALPGEVLTRDSVNRIFPGSQIRYGPGKSNRLAAAISSLNNPIFSS